MSNKSLIGKTSLIITLALLFVAGALASQGLAKLSGEGQRPTVNCSATTDADLVKAVQEKIKADPQFNGQWKQINVSVKGRVVTLNGWVKGKAAVNALTKHARAVQCVKKVVNKMGSRLTVGCPPGMKLCGDICIEKDADCNLIEQ